MLRRTGNWKTLAAVEDHKSAPAQLQLFWDRFRLLRPNHEIFELEKTGGVVLERTLPMMLHGDEGRSKKRQGVLCISCHSVLGRGVQTRKKRNLAAMQETQQMNYTGATHCTRFLLSVLPKFYYDQTDKAFHSMVDFITRDIGNLTKKGVAGPDGLSYYVAIISIKGDWPFLHKVGGLRRSFYNQPKRSEAKKACVGICHWCQAGQPGIPFEDLSPNCEWQFALGVETPWVEQPIVLKNLCHDRSFPESFLHPDPWHGHHLGEGRNFVCNIMRLLLDITPGRNVDIRLDTLFNEYRSFCQRAHTQCYCTKFTENLFGVKSPNDFPNGSWTKGNFTTSLVKWVASFLQSKRNIFHPGSLLEKAVTWSTC